MITHNFPDLIGNRIRLQALSPSGIDDLHTYSLDPRLYKFLEYPPFQTRTETEAYYEKLVSRSTGPNGHYWMIRLESEDKVIGTFGVLDIDWRKGACEIGYGLSPAYWGQGLFAETMTLVLDHLFKAKEFHRVWAKTQSDNLPSIKGLTRAGFAQEGLLRDYYLSDVTDQYHDAVILALLRPQWEEL